MVYSDRAGDLSFYVESPSVVNILKTLVKFNLSFPFDLFTIQ